MRSRLNTRASYRRRRARSTATKQLDTHRSEVQALLDQAVSLEKIRNIILEKYQLEFTLSQYKRAITSWTSRRIETRAHVRKHEQLTKNTSETMNNSAPEVTSKSNMGIFKNELPEKIQTPDAAVGGIQKHHQTRRLEMTLGQWTEVSVMLISFLLKGDLRDELLSQLKHIARKNPDGQ